MVIGNVDTLPCSSARESCSDHEKVDQKSPSSNTVSQTFAAGSSGCSMSDEGVDVITTPTCVRILKFILYKLIMQTRDRLSQFMCKISSEKSSCPNFRSRSSRWTIFW